MLNVYRCVYCKSNAIKLQKVSKEYCSYYCQEMDRMDDYFKQECNMCKNRLDINLLIFCKCFYCNKNWHCKGCYDKVSSKYKKEALKIKHTKRVKQKEERKKNKKRVLKKKCKIFKKVQSNKKSI